MKRYPPFTDAKKLSSAGDFSTLVPGITSPSEVGINYTQSYSKTTSSTLTTSDGKSRNGTITTGNATATITVANNDFWTGATGSDLTEIYLGKYRLKAGVHFAVGTSGAPAADTVIAANIAAAIKHDPTNGTGLPGWNAVAVGTDVTITCLDGRHGGFIQFSQSIRGQNPCLTLSLTDGNMLGSGTAFGGVTLS